MFNSPMSNTSSCASSPFSSPETGADLDFFDMPVPMFYANDSSIYQQIFDMDGSSDLQMASYQSHSPQQKQQQPAQYPLPQFGLGTPPTSPSPSFYKYPSVNETGSMFYGLQQVIQNTYVIPTQPISVLQQSPLPLQEAQKQLLQEQLAYLVMQQGDNNESSLFSSSPTISNLSGSPFSESSPPMSIIPDFDLFPRNNSAVQQVTAGFPSGPVMAPSAASQATFDPNGIFHQMTPPMNHMDILQENASLFKQDLNAQQPLTTDMSLLCNCPGKFPCGEQLGDGSTESSYCSLSPAQDTHDHEHESSESDYEEEQQDDEDQQESDPSYTPTRKSTKKERSKSMTISTGPYSSPYSKDSSPKTPVKKDRRKSSGGSSLSRSHNQQLLEPDMVPEIKDVHVCPVCQRHFTRPFNLRSHLMTHTTARPFPCDECHWKFTRQHDLLRHKRAKHPNSVSSAGQKNNSVDSSITDA